MTDPTPWTLLSTDQHVIHAPTLDTRFRVGIAQPLGPGGSPPGEPVDGEKLPVVYVVDADGMFGLAVETVRCLQIGELMPPALIVGIGYQDATTISDWVNLRSAHLTPTDWSFPGSTMSSTGHAHQFLDFIRQTVKPFVELRYRADPEDATLVGDSLGGLFALYALFHHPEAFQRYVIASPAIAWDDRITFRYASEYAASHIDLDGRVFLSAGALEAEQMLSNVEELAAHLRARSYPSLSLTTRIFDDETHSSVIPGTFSAGLRAVFRTK